MAAKRTTEDGDPLLTVDVVREFMLSKGGEIHNHELVAHFRNFLNDPKRKTANRQKIKEFVNTLAVVKLGPGGDKVLTLRKKFREGGNFGGDPSPAQAQKEDTPSKAGQTKKKEKKEGKATATVKDAKDTSKKSQSCDDLTDKNVAYEDKDDYVLVTKAESRSKSVEELDGQKTTNPFVSPKVSQEFEISHDSLVSPIEEEEPTSEVMMAVGTGAEKLEKAKEEPSSEDNTEKLSVDRPDAVQKQLSHSQNECSTPKLEPVAEEPTSGGLRVKDLARNLNQIESESHSQVRPLAPKNKRESRKPVQQNDDGGADYGMTFTELDRDWLMAAAKCEYLTMRTMLQTNPELARKRDFITGYAPLHWAAKHGKEDVVKLLCMNGADVNVRTRGGYTPLHLAAMQNHASVAELLVIVYGADTNIRDYNGKKAKQCVHKSATANLSSLLSRRPNTVPESPSSISSNSMVGKALFLGLNAVGGLRMSATGKENAPIPKPLVQEDIFLMPPPRELPPVAQKAKPVARQKGTHSDSEMPSPILERNLHGSDSSPNFGTEV